MNKIKHSGELDNFGSGAVREKRKGKGRCDLLPACSLLRLAKHFEDGSEHYGDRNWEKGMPISIMLDSGIRHLLKYMDGQDDEDHLCAAAWNILNAMWMEEKRPDMQDIPARGKNNLEDMGGEIHPHIAKTCGDCKRYSICTRKTNYSEWDRCEIRMKKK